ncbi:MAG: formimidoylglutamase [Gammaproteobacteria bacterium]
MKQTWASWYEPPQIQDWSGRKEETVCRYYQIIHCLDLTKQEAWESLSSRKTKVIILGFCSDEGVKRNQGRVGAKEGPTQLRNKFGKLPLHFLGHDFDIVDGGNITCNGDLEASQTALGHLICEIRRRGILPIVLGGGHETAWGHYLGLHETAGEAFGIINFDAHLDMRPLAQHPAVGTSGTSFLQIAEMRKKSQLPFHYACLGLQMTGNADALFQTMTTWGVKPVFAKDWFLKPDRVKEVIQYYVQNFDSLYVSICLDVFSESVAPGVSAPSALGLFPYHVIFPLQKLAESGKIIGLDIVELAPNLDQNDQTARLGASLLAEFLYCLK